MSASDVLILGQQLKRAREALGLAVEVAAEAAAVPVADLLGWEAQHSEPALEQLEALADFYGRTIDYFLRETPQPVAPAQFRAAFMD